jgi:hypothetical protein
VPRADGVWLGAHWDGVRTEPDLTQDGAFELTMAVASGELRDVDAIAPRFKVTAR